MRHLPFLYLALQAFLQISLAIPVGEADPAPAQPTINYYNPSHDPKVDPNNGPKGDSKDPPKDGDPKNDPIDKDPKNDQPTSPRTNKITAGDPKEDAHKDNRNYCILYEHAPSDYDPLPQCDSVCAEFPPEEDDGHSVTCMVGPAKDGKNPYTVIDPNHRE